MNGRDPGLNDTNPRALGNLYGLPSAHAALLLASFAVLSLCVFRFGSYVALAGLALLGIVILGIIRPSLATYTVIFILYANIADVAYEFHGIPKPIAASVILLMGVPLASLVVLHRGRIIFDRVFLLMGLFLLALTGSALVAVDKMIALSYIANYLVEGLILYILVVNVIRDLSTLRKVIWTMLMAGSLMGGVSLYQEVTHTQNNNYGGMGQMGGVFSVDEVGGEKVLRQRSAGPIGEKNRYAQVLLVLLPLALLRFWGERSKVLRGIAVGATILILSGVLLTFSRGAFVGIVFISLLMVYMRYIKLRQVFVFSLLFVLVLFLAVPDFIVRIRSFASAGSLLSDEGAAQTDYSIRNRFAENLAAVHAFLDHPLIGVGPGQYPAFYSTDYVNKLGIVNQDQNRRAHNLYLELAAETGVLGILVFLMILSSITWPLWKISRRWSLEYPDLANIASSFVLSMFGYMVTAVFLQLAFQRYFWILIALSSATIRILVKEGAERTAARESLSSLEEEKFSESARLTLNGAGA
jgi:putative inorganic carbon (HCO3(-)) transporter